MSLPSVGLAVEGVFDDDMWFISNNSVNPKDIFSDYPKEE